MSLKVKIEELEELDLPWIEIYGRQNHKELTLLYENKILDDEYLEKTLEEKVFKQARNDYELITGERPFPTSIDNVGNIEGFVYALEKGKFSEEEIKKIPLAHKENLETFVSRYRKKNLISDLKEKLLNPEPVSPEEDYDFCCHDCDCGN